jgi:hypothetical protein
MIILMNTAMVANEVVTWAVYRISDLLKVPPAAIHPNWYQNERGKLDVEFSVEKDAAKGVTDKGIQVVVERVWSLEAKPMLDERLAGVHQRRPYG